MVPTGAQKCTRLRENKELVLQCKAEAFPRPVSGVLWKHILWPWGDNLTSGFKNQSCSHHLHQTCNASHFAVVVITGPSGALRLGGLVLYSSQPLSIFPFFGNFDITSLLITLSILRSYDRFYS